MTLSFPDNKYNIIYADPPWRFRNYSDSTASRWVGQHYDQMDLSAIKKLPISDIAANDCVLFMWATFPTLPQAIEVIKAWGFTYKTVAFVWAKQNRKSKGWFWGMGYWTRSNAEICIFATRGHPKRVSTKVHQLVVSPVEKHSKKPNEVRERIVELIGNLPRIELFARDRADGWDGWGLEYEG